jgi:hypothetical protein
LLDFDPLALPQSCDVGKSFTHHAPFSNSFASVAFAANLTEHNGCGGLVSLFKQEHLKYAHGLSNPPDAQIHLCIRM